jgi:hypothetical protein
MDKLEELGYKNCNNWDLVTRTPKDGDFVEQVIINDTNKECLCGHHIEKYYFISNPDGDYIRVGSTCIKQFMGQYVLNHDCVRCGDKLKRNIKSHKCKKCRTIEKKTKKITNKRFFKTLMDKANDIKENLEYKRRVEQRRLERERREQMIEENYCLKCEYYIGNKKYKICFNCKFKECSSCGKKKIKSDSNYKKCYTCFKN